MRCICQGAIETGPDTYNGVVHLSSCEHSTLHDTTKPYVPRKVRRVLGTRRLIAAVEAEEPEVNR